MTPEQQRFNEIADTGKVGAFFSTASHFSAAAMLIPADAAAIKAARERLQQLEAMFRPDPVQMEKSRQAFERGEYQTAKEILAELLAEDESLSPVEQLQATTLAAKEAVERLVGDNASLRSRLAAAEQRADALQKLNESLAARVAAQSELLTKRAEGTLTQ